MGYHTDDLEQEIQRAFIIQEHGPDGVDVFDALAHQSRADPFEVTDETT